MYVSVHIYARYNLNRTPQNSRESSIYTFTEANIQLFYKLCINVPTLRPDDILIESFAVFKKGPTKNNLDWYYV